MIFKEGKRTMKIKLDSVSEDIELAEVHSEDLKIISEGLISKRNGTNIWQKHIKK